MRRARGFTLIDMLLVLALMTLFTLLAVPPLLRAAGQSRVRLAAGELRAALAHARLLAVRHSAHVGVKLLPGEGGRVRYGVFRDGDGDGVRTDDIASGVDPAMEPLHELTEMGRGVGLGFPPGRAPRDPGDPRRRLDRLDDPIRFNNSDIASFGPLGDSTPGTLYVTDGVHHLAAVRVYGRTGRMRTLLYDPVTELWR
jgi:type II secretory pathway pseudopilin PulG